MKETPVILALETATLGGSVCLVRGNEMLSTRIGDSQISHSNSLLKDINETLREAQVALSDVNLFACASGPGSFTGLRIGLATVKALAATLGRPCIGIPSLQAVARTGGPSTGTLALLPAGRGELFVQLHSVSADGIVMQLEEPAHLSPEKLFEKYGALRSLRWTGAGAHVHQNLIRNYAQEKLITFHEKRFDLLTDIPEPGWELAPRELNLAKHVAALALNKMQHGETMHARSLSAIYVRAPDAEVKSQCW